MSNTQDNENITVVINTELVINTVTKERKVANVCYVDGEIFDRKIYNTIIEAENDKLNYSEEITKIIYNEFNASK